MAAFFCEGGGESGGVFCNGKCWRMPTPEGCS